MFGELVRFILVKVALSQVVFVVGCVLGCSHEDKGCGVVALCVSDV
jgi:hypothetical protein